MAQWLLASVYTWNTLAPACWCGQMQDTMYFQIIALEIPLTSLGFSANFHKNEQFG